MADVGDERDEARQRVDSLLVDSQGHEELSRQNNSLAFELALCRARLQEDEVSEKEAQLEVSRLQEQAFAAMEGQFKAIEERDRVLLQLEA